MTLKLGLPSKGRLMEKSVDWFASRGLEIRRTGSEREYAASVGGIDGIDLVLLSAGEIPYELAAGRIHLGITGSDLVRERIPAWESRIEELAQMGFGQADLIIAVPACWIDVDNVDDLDAAAAVFRREHGHRMRIATKYHRLVREFLREAGVADYQLWTARARPKAPSRTSPPKRWPISPRPARRCAPITSRCSPTG